MPPSYRDINYSLRPAKNVERKMLAETFSRLSNFAALDTYRYVGFGSPFYADFLLFHRLLGITRMVNIQEDNGDRERFQFNLPFRCVELEIGLSTDVLARLRWDERTIVWLDYDGTLTNTVLTDIELCTSAAPSGSLIIVTVNAQFSAKDEDPLGTLEKRLGADKLPAGLEVRDLSGGGTSKVYRRIINNTILESMNARNGALPPNKALQYSQLFNFTYRDGALMLTTGGALYETGERTRFAACDFESLPFIRPDEESYNIEIPSLTFSELKFLESQMPCVDTSKLKPNWIPLSDREKFAKVYRYFPHFAEIES